MENKDDKELLEKTIAVERLKAVPFFEDAPCYPSEQLVRLRNLGRQMEIDADNERRKRTAAGILYAEGFPYTKRECTETDLFVA